VDSLGLPKAPYYYLRRSWQPQQITVTDEGLDGLHLHLVNEADAPLAGSVELLLLKEDRVVVARQEVPCTLAPRSRQVLASAALLDRFHDVTYAYRFGPPQQDVAVATLFDAEHRVVSEAFYFVGAREPSLVTPQLEIEAQTADAGCFEVTLHSDHFLRSVSFDCSGYLPDDNFFHLVPARAKLVRFTPVSPGSRFRAHLEALNLRNPYPLRLKEAT
jgi:beta-mannosidase